MYDSKEICKRRSRKEAYIKKCESVNILSCNPLLLSSPPLYIHTTKVIRIVIHSMNGSGMNVNVDIFTTY